MDDKSPQERASYLLKELEKLRDDRGAMANLRRGLSHATEYRAWPWVARWCNLENDRQRIIYTTVAAAFASHPENENTGNVGTVMRELVPSDQRNAEGLQSFDKHFRRLLTCQSAEEVCERLPRLIKAASQKDLPINYVELFKDLCYWGERVKIRWAAAYWNTRTDKEDAICTG